MFCNEFGILILIRLYIMASAVPAHPGFHPLSWGAPVINPYMMKTNDRVLNVRYNLSFLLMHVFMCFDSTSIIGCTKQFKGPTSAMLYGWCFWCLSKCSCPSWGPCKSEFTLLNLFIGSIFFMLPCRVCQYIVLWSGLSSLFASASLWIPQCCSQTIGKNCLCKKKSVAMIIWPISYLD